MLFPSLFITECLASLALLLHGNERFWRLEQCLTGLVPHWLNLWSYFDSLYVPRDRLGSSAVFLKDCFNLLLGGKLTCNGLFNAIVNVTNSSASPPELMAKSTP
jgi:hypothetical protein